MNEFKHWYYGIPFLTRVWLTGTLVVNLFVHFKLLNPKDLVINSSYLAETFQVWQPITCLLYYPVFSGKLVHYAMNCYFIYYYLQLLQIKTFARKPADYYCVVLFQWFCCLIAAVVVIWTPSIMDQMVMAGLYFWCLLNKNVDLTLFKIIEMKAKLLPWIFLFAYSVVYESGPDELLGMAIGYLTYFLKIQLPLDFGGPTLLRTPHFLEKMFPRTNEDGDSPPPGYERNRGARLQD